MGTLEKITVQIRELFASMTPSARIMAGLMAGVIVVSLGWIVSFQQTSQMEFLFGGEVFRDDELKVAEKALGAAGLRNYVREGSRIKVPLEQRDVYLKALAEGGAVPKDWGADIERALNSSNPFEGQSLIDKRFENARQSELARIFMRIPGVEWAAVSHNEKRQGFGRNSQQGASIYLKGPGNHAVDLETMRQICETTTTYFAGLRPENVTVLDLGSGNSYRGNSDPNAADQQPYLQAQRQWEAKYAAQVRHLLSSYGDIKVAVTVELDPTLRRESEKIKYDPVGTATESTMSKRDSKSSKPLDGGRPGAEPNAAFANKSASVTPPANQTSESKETQEDQRTLVGHEATLTKEAPLTPRRVSVSVGVSETYFAKLWRERFLLTNPDKQAKDLPAMTAADLTKLKGEVDKNIRDAVSAILPATRQGDDRFPLVTVVYNPELSLPELPQPAMAETLMAWLGKNWTTVGLFTLVGLSLMMMFSWVKAQSTTEREKQFSQGFGLEVPATMGDTLELGETAKSESGEPQESTSAFQITGGEIKDELSNLIKQNPDAAVNLLRTWIGEAA
jgi:flagellar M-ring protein FliF